jgi:uncharacterized membrane protein YeiH
VNAAGPLPIAGEFHLPIGFELTGVFLLAVTGALLAIKERYDVVGVFVLAMVAGIGGGLVRDGLLAHGPPLALQDARYLYVICAATVLCLVFGLGLRGLGLVFLLVDALGLAVYAIVGTQRALSFGLPPVAAGFIGLANAIGGGLIRDVLTGKETLLFRPGGFYVVAAASGTAVFLGLVVGLAMPASRAALASIAVTFGLRVAAIWFDWRTVEARPLLGRRTHA